MHDWYIEERPLPLPYPYQLHYSHINKIISNDLIIKSIYFYQHIESSLHKHRSSLNMHSRAKTFFFSALIWRQNVVKASKNIELFCNKKSKSSVKYWAKDFLNFFKKSWVSTIMYLPTTIYVPISLRIFRCKFAKLVLNIRTKKNKTI